MSRGDAKASSNPGLIVASYGRRVLVEDRAKVRHACMIRGRKLRPVCGDRVTFTQHAQGNVVTGIEARRSTLSRPDRRGREEVLAANFDQLVVVLAPHPTPDPFITDRYLAAAQLIGVDAAIVLNKIDLGEGFDDRWLDELASVGYRVFRTSVRAGIGMSALGPLCKGHLSLFVGRSGVGKSSLLNALVPELALRTDQVSQMSGEGRHTTTASVLHDLPGGGAVIDSPGVRDYAPAPLDAARVAIGYREIEALSGECRFHNCLHKNEPDCAVRAAVACGRISERRYESYRRLLNLMRQLRPGYV
ncbi:MAG: ribosome small subunit-dependent GTPase A [Gammaproteobacteria bacterium]